jgi:hypothetical protein
LETPKKSSTYLRGYASGFFGVSASFRLNSQNAHDGILFHHPAMCHFNVLREPVFFTKLDVSKEAQDRGFEISKSLAQGLELPRLIERACLREPPLPAAIRLMRTRSP